MNLLPASATEAVKCPYCGSAQAADATFCSSCGQRIKSHVVSSNRRGFKTKGVPLFHSRVVSVADYPQARGGGFLASSLRLVRNLLIIIVGGGAILAFFAFILLLAWGQLSARRAQSPAQAAAAPATTNAVQSATSTSQAQVPTGPTIQIVDSVLDKRDGQAASIGLLKNNAPRIASDVTVMVTFRDAAGQTVTTGSAAIGLMGPGSERTWQVRVPDNPTITNVHINVQWVWR